MIKSLRKRHFQVWTLLLLFIPTGITFAWLAVPNREPVKLLQGENIVLLPVVRLDYDMPAYNAKIRTDNGQMNWQLEWTNKQVLMTPSAVIYRMDEPGQEISRAHLVGRIESRGQYLFPMTPISQSEKQVYLVVYDFIHQQILERINIKL